MPVVQQYIKGLLGDKVPVVLEENPDESVAYGVGMAAAIKERTGDIKDMLLTDICPFSLGTELYDGSFSPVIEKMKHCSASGRCITQRSVTIR